MRRILRVSWLESWGLLALIAVATLWLNQSPPFNLGSHSQVRPPGLEPCWASVAGGQLHLSFVNPGNRRLVLQVGQGSPPCKVIADGTLDDSLIFEPNFRRGETPDPEDYHAGSLVLMPGESGEVTYPAEVLGKRSLGAAGMACWYRTPPLSPDYEQGSVPASIVDDHLVLTFSNPGTSPKTIVIGRGEPEYLFQPGEKPVIMAKFTCSHQFEHECRHGEILTLAPGDSREVRFPTRPSSALRSHIQLTGSCWYVSPSSL